MLLTFSVFVPSNLTTTNSQGSGACRSRFFKTMMVDKLPPLLLLLVIALASASFEGDVVIQAKTKSLLRLNQATPSLTRALLEKAVPYDNNSNHRKLEDNGDDYFLNENAVYSLSGYSLKYAKCQSIQRFSEDAINDGESSAMVKDDIIILRLCPTHSCADNKEFGCKYNYGEYAVGISDYIRIMLRYTMDKKDKMCQYCNECFGNGNDDNYNRKRKRRLDDAQEQDQEQQDEEEGEEDQEEEQQDDEEDQGDDGNQQQNDDGNDQQDFDDDDYYNGGGDDDGAAAGDDAAAANDDAANDDAYSQCNNYQETCYYLQSYCQGYQDDDAGYLQYQDYFDYLDCVKIQGKDDQNYWIKPYCDGYKETIQMDIFYDPYCSQYAGNEINLREYSGLMFKKSIFEDYYAGTCIDCTELNYGPYYGTNSQMCNKIHYESAKCTANMIYKIFDEDYSDGDDSNTCAFIESIQSGTYNQKGEIHLDSDEYGDSIEPKVTAGQTFGLTATLLLCLMLGMYSCYLHHNITNLLIKSLSHSHLLPPSRHRSRSRQRSRTGNKRKEQEEQLDHSTTPGVSA